ncbi:MAG: heavy metal translocating P-type ATPase, partial [Ferrimonas sp.]
LYAGYFYQLELHYRDFLRWISLLFATPVVMYSAQPFYFSALRSLFSQRINMDVPVSLAILLAYGASAKATVTGSGEVYFESVSMFTFFLLLGRLAEQRARRKASEYNSNRQKLIPITANLCSDGNIQQVAARSLTANQRILIRPGEAIPADGRIVVGQSDINESMLTGESTPNLKTVGAIVYAGTINVNQPIEVQVTHTGAQMRVHALLRLQEQAASNKPEIAQLADQIAHYFVPALLMIAGLTYLGWHWWQPEHAFWVTLSVLVAACPCALALATPAALTCGIAKMNKQGLLVRHARALTALPKLTTVLFDKTGTLTNGQFCLQQTQLLAPEWSIAQVQALAAALERHSAHPYSQAFAPFADQNIVSHQNQHHSGQGISGIIQDQRFRLGSAIFAGATNGDGLYLAIDSGPIARFSLNDQLRSDATSTIAALTTQGLDCRMLSGDPNPAALSLASALGLQHNLHGQTPEQKLAVLTQLRAQQQVVAMCGDGVNDAPVLAAADVSIALASGSELAQCDADLILLGQHLGPIVSGIQLARRTHRIIKQNLLLSLAYNGFIVPLAVMGQVAPYVAAAGMSLSSLVVLGNSLRLLHDAPPKTSVAFANVEKPQSEQQSG